MCRFLLAQSENKFKPQSLLADFAKMAQKSKALDGDWQGDGWGIALLDEQNKWQVKKSLLPVWEDMRAFGKLEKANTFVVHARSASFPEHKGVLEFNQPYISGEYAFVFNGLLKSVSLPDVPGRIGAEKIWSLLKKFLQTVKPEEALEKVKNLLIENSQQINALNIGLVDKKNIYALCYYSKTPEYYSLRYADDNGVKIISSEPIGKYKWQILPLLKPVKLS